jgi:enamine deaminase RidA (YjgF/YER057c/UK114 family)
MPQTTLEPLKPRQSMNRQRSPGLDLTIVQRKGFREVHVTLRPLKRETPAALFRRLAETLRQHNATVVRHEVFGDLTECEPALKRMRRLFGEVDWPITWIEGQACGDDKIAGMHLLAVADAQVETIYMNRQPVGRVFRDEWTRHFVLGDIQPGNLAASKPAQTTEAFSQLEAALQAGGMAMPDLVRTWCFLDDILGWYDPFNYARTGFYLDRQVLRRLMPASTGVSGRNASGAALSLGGWAVQPLNGALRVSDVTSPLQCSAASYGSSFSRAVELATPDLRRLFVSGTASIEPGGKSMYPGDVMAQIELTMKVVNGILRSRGTSFTDVSRATAYFKRPSDAPAFAEWCLENGLAFLPAIAVEADICREELLFEVELDTLMRPG